MNSKEQAFHAKVIRHRSMVWRGVWYGIFVIDLNLKSESLCLALSHSLFVAHFSSNWLFAPHGSHSFADIALLVFNVFARNCRRK